MFCLAIRKKSVCLWEASCCLWKGRLCSFLDTPHLVPFECNLGRVRQVILRQLQGFAQIDVFRRWHSIVPRHPISEPNLDLRFVPDGCLGVVRVLDVQNQIDREHGEQKSALARNNAVEDHSYKSSFISVVMSLNEILESKISSFSPCAVLALATILNAMVFSPALRSTSSTMTWLRRGSKCRM